MGESVFIKKSTSLKFICKKCKCTHTCNEKLVDDGLLYLECKECGIKSHWGYYPGAAELFDDTEWIELSTDTEDMKKREEQIERNLKKYYGEID